MGKSRNGARSIDLRHSNGEGDHRNTSAAALIATSQHEEVLSEPIKIEVPVVGRQLESIEIVKARMRERLERSRTGGKLDDEELIQLVVESTRVLSEGQKELELLKKQKSQVVPMLFEVANQALQMEVDSARRELESIIRQNPWIARAATQRSLLASSAEELAGKFPEEVEVTPEGIREARTILAGVLFNAVRDGLIGVTPTDVTIHRRNPMKYGNTLYAPANEQGEVLHLFDRCVSSLSTINEAQAALQHDRKEDAAPYVQPEQEARRNAEEVVSLRNLLLESGLGRIAFVPILKHGKFLGKAIVKKLAGAKVVIFKATTTEAAEMCLYLSRKAAETGEIIHFWVNERYLNISIDSTAGYADFSRIGFDHLRSSLMNEFQRNLDFTNEKEAQQKVIATGTIKVGQLLDGEKGICPIWAKWNDGKHESVVVCSIESDGAGNFRVLDASPWSFSTCSFLSDYTEWKDKAEFLKDKRLWALVELGEESEISHEVYKVRQQKNLKNLADETVLKEFLATPPVPGDYFLYYKWRKGHDEPVPVNAVLRVDDEGNLSVIRAIGRFAKEFFSELTEPTPLASVNGKFRLAIEYLAGRKLEEQEIPKIWCH